MLLLVCALSWRSSSAVWFALLLGHLRVGDQLPTAREVVASAGINPNTMLKAYRQLDAEGIVETRAGAGTFVTAVPDRVVDSADSRLVASLRAWLITAKRSGLDRPAIEAITKTTLDQIF
jgi:GntR family transcriptional regulator